MTLDNGTSIQNMSEGLAKFAVYDGVFFNIKMRSLRDISVMFLNSLGGKPVVLDSTAATGIRGIRYYLEAGVKRVVFLDINKQAYENTKHNIEVNNVNGVAINEDVREFACKNREKFDVIDLDPFGTPVPYLHDLLSMGRDDTIYMVTATDTAVLCGAHASACLREYAAKPLHNELCHEVGIRTLIAYTARLAAELNFGIHVYLSISNLHYMRIFFKVEKGNVNAMNSIKNIGFGSYCNRCHRYYYAPGITCAPESRCESCGGKTEQFGPLWLGSIYDKEVISSMLKYNDNMSEDAINLLDKIYNEMDVPFFYSVPRLTSMLKISSVSQKTLVKMLNERGAASLTHFDTSGIKTSLPYEEVINEIKRCAGSNTGKR